MTTSSPNSNFTLTVQDLIIENENGIHTIYAHLSQIAPTVKVGSVVQKGYVIGRVRNDLTFEVTQRNYHIDPLEMISK